MYGKVAVIAVVGNEDGAHKTIADTQQALNDVGFTIPTQGGTYWVGEAMQTVDYKDLDSIPEKTAATTASAPAMPLTSHAPSPAPHTLPGEVSEQQRQDALALCKQADKKAALACMAALGGTDFRDDLPKVSVPVLHGDGDASVPFDGSGQRIHAALPGSELHVITGAPHGCNVSHADEWNETLIRFLAR